MRILGRGSCRGASRSSRESRLEMLNWFPGVKPDRVARAALAFVRSVEGGLTGQVYDVE